MPYPLTSAYVKVLPKSILAAVFCAIILVYVLADVLAKKLQPKSIFEAFVAEFARHAKNKLYFVVVLTDEGVPSEPACFVLTESTRSNILIIKNHSLLLSCFCWWKVTTLETTAHMQ